LDVDSTNRFKKELLDVNEDFSIRIREALNGNSTQKALTDFNETFKGGLKLQAQVDVNINGLQQFLTSNGFRDTIKSEINKVLNAAPQPAFDQDVA